MPRLTRRVKTLLPIFSLATTLIACGITTALPSYTPFSTEILYKPTTLVPTFEPTLTPISTQEPTPNLANKLSLSGALAEVHYVLPLVVQHVTKTRATIFFELGHPVEGALIYWPTNETISHASWDFFSNKSTRHQVTLEGLVPGVEYQVVVGLLEESGMYVPPSFLGEDWELVHFQTTSENALPLRVGVIGDSGFGGQATRLLVEEMSSFDLNFVLHVGDVVYNVDEDPSPPDSFALKYYHPFAPLLRWMPIYPVVGNHDVDKETQWEGMPYYFQAFPPFHEPNFDPSGPAGRCEWYAFAYGQIQFIMLNTQQFFGGERRAEQTAWLSERLRDEDFLATIVVFHVPPYTSGYHTNDGLAVQSEWVPLFEEARVPLVLSGHDHNYERLLVNGITYIISGGGSAILYSAEHIRSESQVFARRTHFVLLVIHPDRIELSAIALGGEVLDQAVITVLGE